MSHPPRVQLFPTCLGEQFFCQSTEDARRLLLALGVEVIQPEGLTCCGQPAWNAGAVAEARDMARHTLQALASDDALPVVLPSGSCAAMLRHVFPRLLSNPRVRVFELAEYIVDVLGIEELGSGLRGLRVAYHHGCHALRELRVHDQPLALLRNAGAELVRWEAAEECCGFGGLFAVKLPDVSAAMADRKLDTLTGAGEVDVLTSADGGCLLQLGGRLEARDGAGKRPSVVHLPTLLLRAKSGGASG